MNPISVGILAGTGLLLLAGLTYGGYKIHKFTRRSQRSSQFYGNHVNIRKQMVSNPAQNTMNNWVSGINNRASPGFRTAPGSINEDETVLVLHEPKQKKSRGTRKSNSKKGNHNNGSYDNSAFYESE